MSQTWSDDSPPDVGVVIPSGGRGERAGGEEPKQFRAIGGIPMLLRAMRPFVQLPRVHEIVIPLPEPQYTSPPDWLAELLGERLRTVPGGATRADSVLAGVNALTAHCDYVLIHDAARPFVTMDVIERVLARVDRETSVIAAVPMSDTLKRVNQSLIVVETVDRDNLWRSQTPQVFPRALLLAAYDRAPRKFGSLSHTDEASLVEAAGYAVAIVPDSTDNLKLTTPEDFALAEALAAR
jgi:2-C-methyl-D-erythritol 4-phosphate cytidylyltransferase